MNKYQLIQRILEGKKPYTPPLSTEWIGSVPAEKNLCGIKCEEGAFLLLTADGPVFHDQNTGNTFCSCRTGAGMPDNDLDGWTAEIAFAQDVILPCTFDGNILCCEDVKLEIQYRKVRKQLYLLFTGTEYGALMIVLDTARFLVYGAVGSNFLGGYIRNMPQDR